jgi:hypothetical protein
VARVDEAPTLRRTLHHLRTSNGSPTIRGVAAAATDIPIQPSFAPEGRKQHE